MVAHRLSTAAQCDRIAVIEGGRVVEMGEPGGRGWGDINRGRRQGEDHGAVELGFQAMTPHLPVLQGTQSRPPAVAWGAGTMQLCGHSSSPFAGTHHDLLLLPGGRYAALWAKQQASGEEHSELPIAS